ncbi:MAG: hypothetical protein FWD61_15635 [Phycisphaerales bacterium]|nr:hypothetical protein [Phycisphaerales bacterium]
MMVQMDGSHHDWFEGRAKTGETARQQTAALQSPLATATPSSLASWPVRRLGRVCSATVVLASLCLPPLRRRGQAPAGVRAIAFSQV